MVYRYSQTLKVSATVPANTPAGTIIPASITVDLLTGTTVTSAIIPASQSWTIRDVYIKASGDVTVDAQAFFIKNSVKTLFISQPLSSLLISNPSRPRPPPMLYENNTRLSINIVTLVAQGASASSDTFYLDVDVVDSTF